MDYSIAELVTRQQRHHGNAHRLAKGAIIGIAIAAFCVFAFFAFMLWCCCCRGRKKSPQNSYSGSFLSKFTGGRQNQQPPMGYAGQPGYGGQPAYGAPQQYHGGGYAQGPNQEGGYYR